jgi:hypothetical protein
VLHRQLGGSRRVTQAAVGERWKGVCLAQVAGLLVMPFIPKVDLDHLLLDGGWKRGEFDWLK